MNSCHRSLAGVTPSDQHRRCRCCRSWPLGPLWPDGGTFGEAVARRQQVEIMRKLRAQPQVLPSLCFLQPQSLSHSNLVWDEHCSPTFWISFVFTDTEIK